MSAREQIKRQGIFFDQAVYLDVTFYVSRPKNHFGVKGLKPSAPPYPIGRSDLSNMLKFLEDVLNECGVWRDDSQIIDIVARKRYSSAPGTDVVLSDEPKF